MTTLKHDLNMEGDRRWGLRLCSDKAEYWGGKNGEYTASVSYGFGRNAKSFYEHLKHQPNHRVIVEKVYGKTSDHSVYLSICLALEVDNLPEGMREHLQKLKEAYSQ